MPARGVSILAPSFDRLGLIASTPADLAVAWTALGGAIGPPPERVVTLAEDGARPRRARPPRGRPRRGAALSARPVELAGPSLPAFGAPRAIVITAEAAARHDGETAAAQAQLAAGAAHARADVRAARARLDDLGAALRLAVGDGVLVIPALPARPPRWDELEDTTAQLRATGRLTRLCGPVNSSGLVAVSVPSGVQVVAARMETALGRGAAPRAIGAAFRPIATKSFPAQSSRERNETGTRRPGSAPLDAGRNTCRPTREPSRFKPPSTGSASVVSRSASSASAA